MANASQRTSRPVSGTEKGKAKLKTGQQLKRNTVRTKKGSAPSSSAASSSRGRSKKDDLDRLTQMADSCLNAPTPLRRLTEKQRKREWGASGAGATSPSPPPPTASGAGATAVGLM